MWASSAVERNKKALIYIGKQTHTHIYIHIVGVVPLRKDHIIFWNNLCILLDSRVVTVAVSRLIHKNTDIYTYTYQYENKARPMTKLSHEKLSHEKLKHFISCADK